MSKLLKMLSFIVLLFLFSSLLAFLFGNIDLSNKINVIEIKGSIGIDNNFILTSSEDDILSALDDSAKDNTVKGIILVIDSNGGTPVASESIANKVKSIDKPVIALVKSSALSGAYWIASAADKIIASPLSLIGSIGVKGSFLQLSGFLKDHNIEYERLVAGKYKDTASPFKSLSDEERNLLQKKINMIDDYFIESIKENRGLTDAQVKKIETAEFFLGNEAKEINLIDMFGNMDVAKNVTLKLANITDAKLVKKKKKLSFFDYLGRYSLFASYSFGKGFSSQLLQDDFSIKS